MCVCSAPFFDALRNPFKKKIIDNRFIRVLLERKLEEGEIHPEMSEMPNLCGESANDTKIEERPEESFIQDDYKKLKHENECHRQQLHVLRLKLEASEALSKELQERNETLEQLLDQRATKIDKMFAERKEKYKNYSCFLSVIIY